MTDIVVSRIAIFPIKSLDGISVSDAQFLASGAIKHDREFSLCDGDGRWINGKRDARIHTIRSEYDLEEFSVRLSSPIQSNWQTFHMVDDKLELEKWFSGFLGTPVHFIRNQDSGFPDDSHAPGPTIISMGTLAKISSWYDLLDFNETRRRFRTNIELSSDSPFWEDRLFGGPREEISFRMGEVNLLGVKPCKRCVITARDSTTGSETADFQKAFIAKRIATLPSWVNRARFGPLFYRIAVNTRLNSSEAGKFIKVGDAIHLSTDLEPEYSTPRVDDV